MDVSTRNGIDSSSTIVYNAVKKVSNFWYISHLVRVKFLYQVTPSLIFKPLNRPNCCKTNSHQTLLVIL